MAGPHSSSPQAICAALYFCRMTLAWPWLVLPLALCALIAIRWRRAEIRLRRLEEKLAERVALPVANDGPLPTLTDGHRLNPHLFKNTLNTVQSFAYRTNWALERLGRLFDFMLYDAAKGRVSLEEELNFLRDLLELNKLRLGPLFDLRIRIDVPPQDPLYREPLVPPLITAPLLENAFKHGDLDSDHGFIHIQAHLIAGKFIFSVQNRSQDGPRAANRKGGMGNTELRNRLEHTFPGRHSLLLEDGDTLGYKAELTLDLDAALRARG